MLKFDKQKTSLSWLAKAYISNPDAYEPVYALSVVLYRVGKHKNSLDFAIPSEEIILNLKYILAVNWKRFYNMHKSNECYHDLISILDKKGGNLIKYTWGLALLPLISDRKLTILIIENVDLLIDYYAIEDPVDNIGHVYEYKHDAWYK